MSSAMKKIAWEVMRESTVAGYPFSPWDMMILPLLKQMWPGNYRLEMGHHILKLNMITSRVKDLVFIMVRVCPVLAFTGHSSSLRGLECSLSFFILQYSCVHAEASMHAYVYVSISVTYFLCM